MAARPIRTLACSGVVGLTLVLTAAAPARATVSILAVDPATGEVGVAAASCAQFDLARIATVVPGVGVAVSQGHQQGQDPLRVLAAMQKASGASDAIDRVSLAPRPGADGRARQYGVVMKGGGAASLTDSGVNSVAADAGGANLLVVGSDLASRHEVDAAKDAFGAAQGDLAHRLIAGLKAASDAGGDRRCHVQTASAAFIIVASPGERPVVPVRGMRGVLHRRMKVLAEVGKTVAADELGDLLRDAAGLRRPTGPGHPDLYLSLIQPAHGFNAVSLLGQAYRQLLATPTPTPSSTEAPSPTVAASPGSHGGSGGGGLSGLYVALGVVALLMLTGFRRRSSRHRARAARAALRTKT